MLPEISNQTNSLLQISFLRACFGGNNWEAKTMLFNTLLLQADDVKRPQPLCKSESLFCSRVPGQITSPLCALFCTCRIITEPSTKYRYEHFMLIFLKSRVPNTVHTDTIKQGDFCMVDKVFPPFMEKCLNALFAGKLHNESMNFLSFIIS